MSERLPQSKAHNRPKEAASPGFIVGASAVSILTVAGVVGSLVDRIQQEQSRHFTDAGMNGGRLGTLFQLNGSTRKVDGSFVSSQLSIDYSGQLRDGTFPVDFLGIPSDAEYRIGPPLNRDGDPSCVTNIPNGGNITLCAVPKFDGDKLTGYEVESKIPAMARDFGGQEGTVFLLTGSYKDTNGQLHPVVGQRPEPHNSYTSPLDARLVPPYLAGALAVAAGVTALGLSAKNRKSAAQRVAEAEQKVASANQQLLIAQNQARNEREYANQKANEASVAKGQAAEAKRQAANRNDGNSKW